jgi:hypothetical protein
MSRPVCFCCGEELPINNSPATEFRGHPGWGSRFDDHTAGNEPLQIHVCDHCLEAHAERVELRKEKVTVVGEIRAWLCPGCARPRSHGSCPHCQEDQETA